jgi:hypothetical protein
MLKIISGNLRRRSPFVKHLSHSFGSGPVHGFGSDYQGGERNYSLTPKSVAKRTMSTIMFRNIVIVISGISCSILFGLAFLQNTEENVEDNVKMV